VRDPVRQLGQEVRRRLSGPALDRAARSARAHEHVVVAAEAALDRAARLQPLRLGRAGEHGERRGRDEDPEQQRERAAAAVHELAHDDAPHA
jgi:hypothetical protein